MADLFEGSDDVGMEMCQCRCDAVGAVPATAAAEARLLGGGGDPGTAAISMSAYALCAAAFFVMMCFCMWRVMEPLPKIQTKNLRCRLYWCIKANVYVCTLSCFLSVLHCTNFEILLYGAFGFPNNNLIKPLEYIVTCPVMMLILVVMAGEAVPARRQLEVMAVTTCVLICGFAAQMSPAIPVKLMFYISGVTFFLILLQRIEMNVRQHSGGKESLFCGGLGGSAYRKMCLKTALTWMLFPIWFILSPEGLAIVQDYGTAILITAALNIYSKSFYVVYVVIIYDIYVGEDSLLQKPDHKLNHFAHGAAEAVARLGPNEAIAALEKAMKRDQESITQIRSLMLREEKRKEENLKTEVQARQVDVGGAMTPQSAQGMYVQAGGTMLQGMVDPAMMGAMQAGMSNMRGMSALSDASSTPPSAGQQPIQQLPLNYNGSTVMRGGSWGGPDYATPQGMQAQLLRTEMHAAAAPFTLGEPEVVVDMAPKVVVPPLQMHHVSANHTAQQQQQQQQQAPVFGQLSPRSSTTSMPDPDQWHRIDAAAPIAPPSSAMMPATTGVPPPGQEAHCPASGGIACSVPAQATCGHDGSTWRRTVGGLAAMSLSEPRALPVPSREDPDVTLPP